jgi:hypothetical protein
VEVVELYFEASPGKVSARLYWKIKSKRTIYVYIKIKKKGILD